MSMEPGTLSIRELHSMKDLMATVELQQAIWQMQPVDCASPYTMSAIVHNGGCVLGAELDGQLVGFCMAFAAKRGDDLWLWSHMTGVRPGFQGQQIGYSLKQFQKQWALDHGYRVMGWTFDPMQRGNAHFNFNQLGAISYSYYVNHYGEMTDGINAGLASDRLEAYWRLDATQKPVSELEQSPVFLVESDTAGAIHATLPDTISHDLYAVEIPYEVGKLKQTDLEKAKAWQLHVRQAMTTLLAAGFIVSGFTRENGRCWYLLSRTN